MCYASLDTRGRKQSSAEPEPLFKPICQFAKSSLTQGKAGASAYVARRVSPGLDRGLEVTIDRNFNKYSKFLVVLENGSNH